MMKESNTKYQERDLGYQIYGEDLRILKLRIEEDIVPKVDLTETRLQTPQNKYPSPGT